MSLAQREHVFANSASFENIGYGPRDVIVTERLVWGCGEYSLLYKKLVTFLNLVLKTDEVAFTVEDQGHRKQVWIRSAELAGCFRDFNCLPDICFGYSCSPDVKFFLDCYFSHYEIRRCAFGDRGGYVVDGWVEAEVFNDFVEYMRSEAKRRGVKKAVRDWLYGLTKVERDSIRKYLRTLPNASTKLLAVRCELQYRLEAICDDHVLVRESLRSVQGEFADRRFRKATPECASRIDPRRAMEDRNCFVENQLGKDGQLFEHMLGYVWKIEQSTDGIVHHHVLFVFDGQSVKDEFAALDRVAVRWESITKGAGFLHSSHYRKKDFIKEGRWHYGYIDCHKPEILEAMIEDAASYFTKDEQPLRFKPTPHTRALTKRLPHKAREGGPGRPRKQEALV